MTTFIDIHPHIIASDTARYPLAPLGGHQSEWSRTRPVTTEQMIVAMDKAGVAKSAIVQASTCYGHDNSYVADAVAAHPDRFTGVFSVDVLAADAPRAHALLASAAGSPACVCSRSAARCRTRRPGSTIPRPIRPGNAPASWALDLPADVAKGVPADDQDGGALSEGADHPRSHGAAGAGRRTALCAGAQPVRARPLSEHLSQAHAAQRSSNPARVRRRPRPSFPSWFGVRRIAAGLGLELSVLRGLAARAARARQAPLASLPQSDQDWIFAKTAQTLYPALAD